MEKTKRKQPQRCRLRLPVLPIRSHKSSLIDETGRLRNDVLLPLVLVLVPGQVAVVLIRIRKRREQKRKRKKERAAMCDPESGPISHRVSHNAQRLSVAASGQLDRSTYRRLQEIPSSALPEAHF